MADCCNYTGTCRACLGSGRYWFTTETDSNCCINIPFGCGKSIKSLAEKLGECKDSSLQSTIITSSPVLATFFIVAIVAIIVIVKRGGCSAVGRFFTRRAAQSEDEPMIPMLRFSRSGSVYSHGLTDVDLRVPWSTIY